MWSAPAAPARYTSSRRSEASPATRRSAALGWAAAFCIYRTSFLIRAGSVGIRSHIHSRCPREYGGGRTVEIENKKNAEQLSCGRISAHATNWPKIAQVTSESEVRRTLGSGNGS